MQSGLPRSGEQIVTRHNRRICNARETLGRGKFSPASGTEATDPSMPIAAAKSWRNRHLTSRNDF